MLTSTKLKFAYAALAATDTALSGSTNPKAHSLRRFTKPLLMPTLIGAFLTDPRTASSPLRTTTVIAQTAGWVGDVALLGDGPADFARGASSFGVGHAAYITGFLRQRDPSSSRTGPKAIAALWTLTAPGVVLGAARQRPALAPLIAGYSATLSTTAAAATQLEPALPVRARRASLGGALLFMLSDSLLGARKFLLPNPPHALEAAVMATYTGAQFLLAEGAAAAGGPA